ncbi:MAG: glutamate--tRNA ligase, partial [Ureaplasma sp.]|nr:glutamate--tRNA ligase [Ureaplasma sp.]
MKIRSRYAPSPTGYFHIGGARTAIFNYLFAKHNKGDFIVRIEDTDVERNVPGGIESQLNNLNWLGITPDESIMNPGEYGPYIQSEKLSRYEELAEQLVKEGKAYYCFCSKEKLDAQRDEALKNHKTPRYQRNCINLTEEEIKQNIENNIHYIIRLKINDNKMYSWYDTIRGKISVIGSSLTDPAILKSNRIAMYNFAVVVDDYDMKITHVLRGEEHISNTPYQLAIAEALRKDMSIKYGHLSVIVDETGKKLSKRNEALKQFIEDYQKIGCMPEALFNFLTLLGWSSVTNKEVLSSKEIIEEFNLDAISKAPAYFDEKKLSWISNEYFKKSSNEEYLNFVSKFVDSKFKADFDVNTLNEILLVFKNQIT